MLGNGHMRKVAAAAVTALGLPATPGVIWRFAWDWWYQRTVDELISFQADRLTPEWVEAHVSAPDRLPPAGSILVSIHQYNLPIAATRSRVACSATRPSYSRAIR